jgi:STAM-binding protein
MEKLKPMLVGQFKELQEQKRRAAQRLREANEAAAREAYERSQEAAKLEAAREARMAEIRVLESARAYESAKQKKADELAYLEIDGIAPASSTMLSTPPMPSAAEPAVSPVMPTLTEAAPRFFSESGAPLRHLQMPSSLVPTFMSLASPNTKRGVETCGVLAGRLSKDAFTLTHLIVPKQEGTTDTCAMVAEEEILEAQDRQDLLTLGWIHTHPTQACFLSSIDLHTHFPYQLMMAEAVAVVCAPTQSPDYGVFRLTDPPGLDTIANCSARGFHPHRSDVQIYRSVGGPGSHAQFYADLPLQVIDLRHK